MMRVMCASCRFLHDPIVYPIPVTCVAVLVGEFYVRSSLVMGFV
jgi:hypothetical protein